VVKPELGCDPSSYPQSQFLSFDFTSNCGIRAKFMFFLLFKKEEKIEKRIKKSATIHLIYLQHLKP